MHKTAVIDIVGLSSSLIGDHTPFLKKYIAANQLQTIKPVLPGVTTSVQSTFLTGKWPGEHGIVGNGWYDRVECEVKFWKQSNKLVQGEKIWEKAKKIDPSFTVAQMFWWYNMYSGADYSVTPRPNYLADGPAPITWPMAVRSRIVIRILRNSGMNCRISWGSFRFSASGGRGRISVPASGSPMLPFIRIGNIILRYRLSTCRTSTIACRNMATTCRRSAPISSRSIA